MLLLLTGASGVGKSTCRIAIEAALGDELDRVENTSGRAAAEVAADSLAWVRAARV